MSDGVNGGEPAGAGDAAATTRLELNGLRVVLAPGLELPRPDEQIPRLLDPGSAERTLHWGRNYLYEAGLETAAGSVAVVVKQFRHTSLKARIRRCMRGSKAARSWEVARYLRSAGFSTPEPLILVDSEELTGPSFYVSRLLDPSLEFRYLMRALNDGAERELFPHLDADDLVRRLGRLVRQLHDARIWYRDMTSGNVLIHERPRSGRKPDLYLVDLNRARVGKRLSRSERMRDLSRLPLHRPRDQELLLAGYDRDSERRLASPLLYRLYHRAFLFKNRSKRTVRGGLKRLADALLPRSGAHAHLPPPASDASLRDKIVWDHLSDQPHQHAGRLEKLRVRLEDSGSHLRGAYQVLGALPGIWRRYRELRGELYTRPVAWNGVGVALRPLPQAPAALLEAVDDLGVRDVLVRLHPWEEDDGAELDLARALSERGLDLTFALPQNRDLVRDPKRWSGAVERIAEQFTPYGRNFQIGQAPNRSKWGVWKGSEYARLASSASEILRRHRSDVQLLGPAVIDFEPYVTAHLLEARLFGLELDVLSSLLYVDRRGAPENRQLGFDTVGKVTLLKALAERGRNCRSGRSWITEVNWPLWEGPHSPAGRDVAVDEEQQADFLVRYYLLALGSGLVERVYWWQLIAKGYGLIDPGAGGKRLVLRRRASFRSLSALRRQLEGAVLHPPLAAPERSYLYPFELQDGASVVVGWTAGERAVEAELPAEVKSATDRDGAPLPMPDGRRVSLTGSPVYWRLVR